VRGCKSVKTISAHAAADDNSSGVT